MFDCKSCANALPVNIPGQVYCEKEKTNVDASSKMKRCYTIPESSKRLNHSSFSVNE